MFMRARFTEEVGSGEEEGFIDSGEGDPLRAHSRTYISVHVMMRRVVY